MARFREGKEWFIISFRSKVGRSAGDREVEEIESWGGGGRNCTRNCLSNQRAKETEQRSRFHDHRLRIDYILFAILRYNFIPSIGFGARRPGY